MKILSKNNCKLLQKYGQSSTLGIHELKSLHSDLQKAGAPQYTLDWTNGRIKSLEGNLEAAIQSLLNAYIGSSDFSILEAFFKTFADLIQKRSIDTETLLGLINLLIEAIKAEYKKDTNLERRAKISCYLAYLLYFTPGIMSSKRYLATQWLNIVKRESISDQILAYFAGSPREMPPSHYRFFSYLIACCGLEDEVIIMNDILAKNSEIDDFSFSRRHPSVEHYTNNNAFQFSTEIFCNTLLDIDFKNVLDVGCGPGRVGQQIHSRCEHILGIDEHHEYAHHALNTAHYHEVITGDAFNEIPKLKKKFDLVTFCMVLDYLPGKELLKISERHLKKGGYLAFSFLPALKYYDNKAAPAFHYEKDFFSDLVPDLVVKKSTMSPYMWGGGYYVLLKKIF